MPAKYSKNITLTPQLAEIQTRIATGVDQLKRGQGISGPPRKVLGERLERFLQRRKN